MFSEKIIQHRRGKWLEWLKQKSPGLSIGLVSHTKNFLVSHWPLFSLAWYFARIIVFIFKSIVSRGKWVVCHVWGRCQPHHCHIGVIAETRLVCQMCNAAILALRGQYNVWCSSSWGSVALIIFCAPVNCILLNYCKSIEINRK